MKVVYFMVLQYLRVYCNEANDNSDDDDDDSTEIYHSANTYIQSEGDVMLESINTGRSSLAVMELNHGGDYKAYTSSDTEIYDDNDSTESDDETTAVNNSTIQSDDFKTEAQRTDEKYNSDDNVRNFLENLFDVVPYPKYNDIPMLNRKIFRGVRVTIMEHPYIVSIRRQLVHYLMGAILTRNVIITVAHPIYQVPITELKVIAGQNYNDRGTTLHTVILTIIHEDFQPSNLQADLALLMTFEFIVFKFHTKPIPISYPGQSLEGETAFVTGWGRCDRSGKELCLPRSSEFYREEIMDPMLRTVKFKIKSTSCEKYYQDKELSAGMMCAGDMRSEEMLSPCMAVPGAPLVVEGNLVGLQSWGFGCGYVNDHPLVYTSLTVYQPWLVHNIPILRQIQRTQLSSLFQATKASYLSQWLLKTRVNVPAFKMPLLDVLRPLDVDTDLVKLNGTITDIRDYIFDYKYKNQKRLMYGELKNHLKIQDVHETYQNSQVLRASPFLNDSVLNDMGLSQSNGTLIEVGKSEEDSYYKELTSKDSTESNRINNQNTEFDSFYQTEAKPSVYF